MSTTTKAMLLGTFVALLFTSSQAQEPAANLDNSQRLSISPVVAGTTQDSEPFDGFVDFTDVDIAPTVGLSPGQVDFRAVYEFDISNIAGRSIRRATLKLIPGGKGVLPGTFIIPVEVRSYIANGALNLNDFHRGNFVTAFDLRAAEIEVPITIDVTNNVRNALSLQRAFLGFTLRTNIESVLTFGSADFPPSPKLVITFD